MPQPGSPDTENRFGAAGPPGQNDGMSHRGPRSVPVMLAGFLAVLDLSAWLPRAEFALQCLALALLIVAVLVAAHTVSRSGSRGGPTSGTAGPGVAHEDAPDLRKSSATSW